jgi:hypothetical protein
MDDSERALEIAELVDEIMTITLDEDNAMNLGSEENYPALSIDEWAIDEVNEQLEEFGIYLSVEFGQVFLNAVE